MTRLLDGMDFIWQDGSFAIPTRDPACMVRLAQSDCRRCGGLLTVSVVYRQEVSLQDMHRDFPDQASAAFGEACSTSRHCGDAPSREGLSESKITKPAGERC